MQISNDIQSRGRPGAGRPIGYWLKHLDRLIEDTFSRALAADGLTRRHWQVLNTLARGPASPAELATALEPFLHGDPAQQATTVDDLSRRGCVSRDQDRRLCLTPHGRTAHQISQERVQQTRDLLLRGVSADEYAAVIATLARMAANLERSLSHPHDPPQQRFDTPVGAAQTTPLCAARPQGFDPSAAAHNGGSVSVLPGVLHHSA